MKRFLAPGFVLASTLAFAAGEPPLVVKSGQTQQLPAADTLQLGNVTGSTQCIHADASGNLTGAGFDCGSGSGTVTITGTPAAGQLTKFSGATSISNGDISGDCTTAGALAITCLRTNGSAFAASATIDTTNAANISSGILSSGRISGSYTGVTAVGTLIGLTTASLQDSGISGSTQCVHADSSGNFTGTGFDCGAETITGLPLTIATWRFDSATTSTSSATNSFAAHGNFYTPDHAVLVYSAAFQGTTVTGATYKVCAALWDTTNHKITTTPICSATWTATTGHAAEDIAGTFPTPLSVAQGQAFTTYYVRTDATGTTSSTAVITSANPITQPGFFAQSTANVATDLASTNPTPSDTWTVSSNVWHVFNFPIRHAVIARCHLTWQKLEKWCDIALHERQQF